jgi:arginase
MSKKSKICAPHALEHGAKNFSLIKQYWNDLAPVVKQAGGFPLVLGGDHANFTGAIRGIVQRNDGKIPGIIYIDAHADINDPKHSPSGNMHGMPVHFAYLEGNVDFTRFAYVGLRNPDNPYETTLIKQHDIMVITKDDLERDGIVLTTERLLRRVGHGAHISFDVDAIDEQFVPGTGTPEPHGLTPEQVYALVAKLQPGSMDMNEVDPLRDVDHQTVNIAIETVLNATLGQKDVHLISAPTNLGQPNPGTAVAPQEMIRSGLIQMLEQRGQRVVHQVVPVQGQPPVAP